MPRIFTTTLASVSSRAREGTTLDGIPPARASSLTGATERLESNDFGGASFH
ncbi:MAG: hypothetical protein GY772_05380 [bacterium]|nr:hypothetical protein [bacterium]